MTSYDYIAVIYNPHSTGAAETLARAFVDAVEAHHLEIGIAAIRIPTNHPGHAVELAEEIAATHTRPLIVAASGDGGYNEVVNGVMRARTRRPDTAPVVAVIGAGNANDHKRTMRGETTLIDLVLHASPQPLDLLKLTAGTYERYAHSYIGLGLSSEVSDNLDTSDKGAAEEVGQVVRTLHEHEPFTVVRNGKKRRYDSLIFANINEMAKIFRLSDQTTPSDGVFEVVAHRHASKFQSILSLLRIALFGAQRPESVSSYVFSTDAEQVQLDGEVDALPGTLSDEIHVECVHRAVYSLYAI